MIASGVRKRLFVIALAACACSPAPSGAVGWERIQDGPELAGNALAVDVAGDRLVSFGGTNPTGAYTSEVWVRPLPGGAWSKLSPSGTPPSVRTGATMIYDAAGQRMLVYGGTFYSGFPSSLGGEVYALSLGASPAWSPLVPATNGPTYGTGSTLVLDSRRHRLVAFGGGYVGRFSVSQTNGTWVAPLDGTPEWTLLSPGGAPPLGRYSHVAWYDSTTDRMFVHAGYSGLLAASDTWALAFDPAPQWSQLADSPVNPGAQHGPTWTDAPARRGWMLESASALWSLNLDAAGAEWEPHTIVGPLPGGPGSPAWDASRHRAHARTGTTRYGTSADWDLLLGDGPDTVWAQPIPHLWTPPVGRGGSVLQYDDVRDRFVVVPGGDANGGLHGDTHAVDAGALRSWSAFGAGPTPRRGAATALDALNARLLLFGGRDASGDRNDLWEMSLVTGAWNQLFPAGAPPDARAYATLVADPAGRRAILFGGAVAPAGATTNGLRDCWVFPLDGLPAWTSAGTAPRWLYDHTANWDPAGQRMLVLGGVDWPAGGDATAGNWLLSLSFTGQTPHWAEVPTTGLAWNLNAHAAALDTRRSRLIALGGDAYAGFGPPDPNLFQWQLDLATMHWDTLPPPGPQPEQRYAPQVGYDPVRDRIVLFGGYFGSASYSDTWVLPFDDVTPALASLLEADWNGAAVALRWRLEGVPGELRLERRGAQEDWKLLATLLPDGGGEVAFADRSAGRGASWDYRIRAFDSGQWTTLGTASVSVPLAAFVLRPAVSSDGRLRVAFELPDGTPALLELFDIAGRRLAGVVMSAPEPGAHAEALGPAGLASGVYFLRLSRAGESLRARAVVLR